MTVAEMIAELSKMDPNATVVIARNQTRLGDGDVTITDWEEGYFLPDTDHRGNVKDSGTYMGQYSDAYTELDDENKSNSVKAVYFC